MARTAAHNQKISQAMAARHQHARDVEAECQRLRAEVARLREVNREQAIELGNMRTEVAATRSALNRLGAR